MMLKSCRGRVLAGIFLSIFAIPALGHITSAVDNGPAEAATVRPGVAQPRQPESQPSSNAIELAKATATGISEDVLKLALDALSCATASGEIAPPPTLTVIDYSRPSSEPRLWVFDMATGELLFRELVAHGRGTGENMATRFSDAMNSHQTSLGLFVTGDTYVGSNGYSLRIDGLEPGFNGRARDRAIVMHGAPYVNAEFAARQGRLGRSWGCPALREAVARDVIDIVRGGGVIFSYYPDSDWLTSSRFLNGCGGAVTAAAGD
jgi:hypothetical protein